MKLDLGEPVDFTGDGLMGSLWGGLRHGLWDRLVDSLWGGLRRGLWDSLVDSLWDSLKEERR